MATLIFTAVGSAIGGPIGGAIGAIVGQQFDQNILFRPKRREGPRLQELAVQTSSYGSQIPGIFGRMRVAGTVIWATDLKESRSREGGGKGQPSTTIYSYSACFAVALSSRSVQGIGRIWADGKIFRGSAGDFKTDTQFAFHAGHEDQAVDGLMASAEANGGTPAYRDCALAVFGDMDLTDYGNRIPSLTFEVIADDGSVSIAEIVRAISDERVDLAESDALTGFAAAGEDRHAALEALADIIPLSFSSDPDTINRIAAEPRFVKNPVSVVTIDDDFLRNAGREEFQHPEARTAPITAAARQISVRYYDPERDYQSGIQSAFRPGSGRLSLVRDFPATIAASTAKSIAATALWSAFDERSTMHVAVPIRDRLYRPGLLVEFVAFEGLWRIRECEVGRGFVQLSLTRATTRNNLPPAVSDQGRHISDSDLPAGLTRLVLVDLPFAIDAPTAVSDSARLYAVAAGNAGWRSAQVFASGADGAPGAFIGKIPAPSVIGTASGVLDAANPALIDQMNHVDVALHNPDMTLALADDSQLLAGSNIALIGREIIQFAAATPLGEGQFRLSRLFRGLGGTEGEVAGHGADEDFVLLDAGAMLEIGPSAYSPFSPVTVFALGREDPLAVSASIPLPGRALMPWNPVHPRWSFLDQGDLSISWTRRSRAGTIWSDFVDVALAEEAEKYRVELSVEGESEIFLSVDSDQPEVIIPAAHIISVIDNNYSYLSARIYQVGAHSLSPPLLVELPL